MRVFLLIRCGVDEELLGGFVGIESKPDNVLKCVATVNSKIIYSPRGLVMWKGEVGL